MSYISSSDKFRTGLKYLVNDQDKGRGEIVFTYHQTLYMPMWLNKEEITQEMKRWKKLRKEGKLKIYKENNKTVQVQGTTWYMMCMSVDEYDYDPIALMGLDNESYPLSGFCYFFKHEINRDMTANYIGME